MNLTEKHAEFVGLHFGDGSLIYRKGTNRLRFQLRGDAKADREHYDSFIIPLCNEIFEQFLGRKVGVVWDKKLNSYGVSIESNKLNNFFAYLGIPIGVKQELMVPEWIIASEPFSKAFVRGLFDTDGTISYKRNNTAKTNLPKVGVIHIVSTSKVLISQTSGILSRLKIKHYFRKYVKKNGEKTAYIASVYRPHVHEFMDVIGSHNPKHINKFLIAQKFGFCPTKTTPEQRTQILKGFLDPSSLVNAGVP